jgi:NADP-dependent 3-hydroxy acid dehydrogenase YdfG
MVKTLLILRTRLMRKPPQNLSFTYLIKLIMEDNLKNKVVAITGASSGIGKATAILLAKSGVKVVLGARDAKGLETVANEIKLSGGEAVFMSLDVRRRDDLTGFVDLAITSFGKLDVLFNNAGIAPNSLMDELRLDDWDAMIDINLRGVLHGIAAALPVFRKQGFGHIINTASTAGIVIKPTMAVYAATKFAVRALSEGLRQEAGGNLRVTVITPGIVNTNLADSMSDPDVKAQIAKTMAEIAISPDAIAGAVVYAISQPGNVDIGEIIVRPTAQA